MFKGMLSKCQSVAPQHKFRFKNPLSSLDATVIDLCFSLYDWAKFRTTKGAVKLLVKLNHAGSTNNFSWAARFSWSLYTLCSILPTNIFLKRNFWDWLNDPFHKPKSKPVIQYELAFG